MDPAPIVIRPIRPDDKEAVARGFSRLGERSRYRRFLAPHGDLSRAELRYFTEVDHVDHEALVAIDPATAEGVGVARYVRLADDSAAAEMAVAVVDDWQGRGVGGRLTAALAERARAEGIRRFTALVLAENERVVSLLQELGTVHAGPTGQGTLQLTVELGPAGLDAIPQLLRALAGGDLRAIGQTAWRAVRVRHARQRPG